MSGSIFINIFAGQGINIPNNSIVCLSNYDLLSVQIRYPVLKFLKISHISEIQ